MVYPAFQWAQSLGNVYLDIKYSHKLDSPGHLEVVNETVNITKEGVMLSADVDHVEVHYYTV